MIWPRTIEVAIETIEAAGFLTAEQKRDIFYNSAARFLRLSHKEIAKDHGHQKQTSALTSDSSGRLGTALLRFYMILNTSTCSHARSRSRRLILVSLDV
jgi:hypothetical protein